ncbi:MULTISPECIES: hypothetical protein [unclassified Sphingopyxis]|uniref:hypothetical protein n=1 Tax=unclassified Sphingopyxis TaxID=2614943 RepID=UPI0028662999|nr:MULTISPECIES: hypothetical protein [unclassified Sphingopyxis]MDR6834666.1 hypothetical protein [Sphingopyxis sp. BE122]MDR7226936.1 hypothetical protein [Sphingopyxis sp. BE259]
MFSAYSIGRVKPFLAEKGPPKNGGKLGNFTRESIFSRPLSRAATHLNATKETDVPSAIVAFVALSADTHRWRIGHATLDAGRCNKVKNRDIDGG